MKVPDNVVDTFNTGNEDSPTVERLTLKPLKDGEVRTAFKRQRVGNICECPTYDCLAYYSVRNEFRHFYKIGKAYPIDDDILFKLKQKGVEKIFVGLEPSLSILEFDFEQYMNYEHGEKFNKGHGNQRYTPQSNALRVWPNAVGSVIDG